MVVERIPVIRERGLCPVANRSYGHKSRWRRLNQEKMVVVGDLVVVAVVVVVVELIAVVVGVLTVGDM